MQTQLTKEDVLRGVRETIETLHRVPRRRLTVAVPDWLEGRHGLTASDYVYLYTPYRRNNHFISIGSGESWSIDGVQDSPLMVGWFERSGMGVCPLAVAFGLTPAATQFGGSLLNVFITDMQDAKDDGEVWTIACTKERAE